MPDVIISGPEGRIEARYHSTSRKNAPIALVLHPHPQQGGNMNNKVTYTLYHSFLEMGFHVLRFNFRGVGRSEGTSDCQGDGELSDASACLNWLQSQNPEPSHCWIAGFSFGAWVSLQLLMRRPEFNGFVAVSPPANLYDFTFLAPCPVSGMIIQGDNDAIVPKESVQGLAQRLCKQKGLRVQYREIPGADHFFQYHLQGIHRNTLDYVLPTLTKSPVKHSRQGISSSEKNTSPVCL